MDRFDIPLSNERSPLRKQQNDEMADHKEQEVERMNEQVDRLERYERKGKMPDPIGN